jgi:hypothetical protein
VTDQERAVRHARRALAEARAHERALQQAIVDGDMTIDAAMLAEAEAGIRLAALRVQAAERLAAEHAAEQKRKVAEEGRRRRQRAGSGAKVAQRAGWVRAIDSGAALARIAELIAQSSLRDSSFPPEYLEVAAERWKLEQQRAGGARWTFPDQFLDILARKGFVTAAQRDGLLDRTPAGRSGGRLRDACADPDAAPAVRQVDSPLRDAAVDPRTGDRGVPSNAGTLDPHDPVVTSPGLPDLGTC